MEGPCQDWSVTTVYASTHTHTHAHAHTHTFLALSPLSEVGLRFFSFVTLHNFYYSLWALLFKRNLSDIVVQFNSIQFNSAQFNSILIYLHANSTAEGPITK
jgi:hypothetical protein